MLPKELGLRVLRDLARRITFLAWLRPALAGIFGGALSGAMVWAFLPPGHARTIGALLYDYQILLTGVAAIAAAGITYRAALRQMRYEREKEERSRQNRSYALILEMLPKVDRIKTRVVEKIALVGALSGDGKHYLALGELIEGTKDIRMVNYHYTWHELSDLNPAVTAKVHLFVYALEEFYRMVEVITQRPVWGGNSPGTLRSQAAGRALQTLGGVATDLHYSLGEELEALAAALNVHTATVQLAKAVHERVRVEIEAEAMDAQQTAP